VINSGPLKDLRGIYSQLPAFDLNLIFADPNGTAPIMNVFNPAGLLVPFIEIFVPIAAMSSFNVIDHPAMGHILPNRDFGHRRTR
jgi:hypothetical protein